MMDLIKPMRMLIVIVAVSCLGCSGEYEPSIARRLEIEDRNMIDLVGETVLGHAREQQVPPSQLVQEYRDAFSLQENSRVFLKAVEDGGIITGSFGFDGLPSTDDDFIRYWPNQ